MAKPSIVTGLDIGTSKIKVLVAQKEIGKEDLKVLSLIQEPAFGIRKGVIINVDEASKVIQIAIDRAKSECGQKIDSVFVNINGSHIFVTSSHGTVAVSRADQKISEEDISRVLQAAQTFSLPSNKEVLDVFPKEFIVDGQKQIKEACGMQGMRLEAEVLILGAFSPYFKNLTQAVLDSNLQILDVIPSPIAAARACLNPRQKELGVALLDIGAGTSSLAVFEENDLIHTAIFPIGSGHITNDIAIGLRTDIDIAEKIKIEFGSCLFQGGRKKEKIGASGAEESLIFSQKKVIEIIEARVSEIFGEIQKELKKISRQGLLPAGIVLTGGGAKLPKIVELAKKELKSPCRIGRISGFPELEDDPELATVCGLVLMGSDSEGEINESMLKFFNKGIGNIFKKIFKMFIP